MGAGRHWRARMNVPNRGPRGARNGRYGSSRISSQGLTHTLRQQSANVKQGSRLCQPGQGRPGSSHTEARLGRHPPQALMIDYCLMAVSAANIQAKSPLRWNLGPIRTPSPYQFDRTICSHAAIWGCTCSCAGRGTRAHSGGSVDERNNKKWRYPSTSDCPSTSSPPQEVCAGVAP